MPDPKSKFELPLVLKTKAWLAVLHDRVER